MPRAGHWLRRDTPSKRALQVATLYAFLAGLWIAFSDQALARIIDDSATMAWAQTLKGWFFVLVTASLLFILVHRATRGLLRGYRAAVNATRDELTGLAGRAAIRDLGPAVLARAECMGEPAAFIMLDVDRLNRVNDAFGVGAGNAILMGIARRLQRLGRADLTLVRPGSDEFLIMVAPPCTPEAAEELVRDILSRVNRPYRLAGETVQIGVCAGIACYPRDGQTVDELVLAADKAVSAAEPGNDIVFFKRADEKARQLFNIENALNHALEKKQFRLFMQPVVDLDTGAILGAEALIRWEHPRLGLVSPGHFIPMLEHNGGIHDVGAWVLEEAIRGLHQWPDSDGLQIGVNVSRIQLETPDFLDYSAQLMDRANGQAGSLILEMTESMAMRDPEVIISRLRELKTHGHDMAMDDFGTGYSSLAYLKRFPFDYIKIDRAFVRGIPDDVENDLLVQTMRDMTSRLGKRTVAEGVEIPEEARRLRQLGFRGVQGYLFDRPMPADDFGELLVKKHEYPVYGEASKTSH